MNWMRLAGLGLSVWSVAPALAADTVFQGDASPPNEPLSLWYRQPATKWVEALPVGNGRLGAMVFGGVNQERLQLNEEPFGRTYAR